MILGWLRQRRRRALLAQPFPVSWNEILRHNVRGFAALSIEEQARARAYVQVFVAEKHWEGCAGLVMTDEIKVTIAAHVAILVLGFREQYFDRVLSILVYPTAYVASGRSEAGGGIVLEGDSARSGEAWYRGPVILSWPDVIAGGRKERHGNVVFHEFAHQLDMLNGRVADGTPPQDSLAEYQRWTEVIGEHYRRLVHDCEHEHPTLLDCYGATNLAEFFAVATETFFTRPHALQHRHPALFAILCQYYRQNPGVREVA